MSLFEALSVSSNVSVISSNVSVTWFLSYIYSTHTYYRTSKEEEKESKGPYVIDKYKEKRCEEGAPET